MIHERLADVAFDLRSMGLRMSGEAERRRVHVAVCNLLALAELAKNFEMYRNIQEESYAG